VEFGHIAVTGHGHNAAFSVIMISIMMITNIDQANYTIMVKNPIGGFCLADSFSSLSPGGIHHLSFYKFFRSPTTEHFM